MIQRIQTIYLLIAIAAISIVLLGNNVLVYFIGASIERYDLTLFGIVDQEQLTLQSSFNFPLYIFAILLIPLLVLSILSYKNLKRQSLLISVSIGLYSLLMVAILVIYFFSDIKVDDIKLNSIIGAGFYILGIGLPFLFLANNGVKRDKNLIDSLNRLR